ncbi:helix-turn-helix XRE-family transcriptional regulators [Candidatus Termititenax aidoneus]|uniref:Helix-turn-helix XRE-family transcriptional regulators n=1 Tax=Termititenax aidoneus TaxID=2218524 RepID=A0A388TDM3_TERA1|nr:helix-turn-helix XRE-family transcriptional regulators [Candidatus Termititenax aidoneus]
MNLRQIFIRNLKRIRKGSGLSQMQLALLCETAAGYIGAIETGLKFPSVEMVEKIAAALRIKPYQLFLAEQHMPVKIACPKPELPEELRHAILNQLEILARKVRKY